MTARQEFARGNQGSGVDVKFDFFVTVSGAGIADGDFGPVSPGIVKPGCRSRGSKTQEGEAADDQNKQGGEEGEDPFAGKPFKF